MQPSDYFSNFWHYWKKYVREKEIVWLKVLFLFHYFFLEKMKCFLILAKKLFDSVRWWWGINPKIVRLLASANHSTFKTDIKIVRMIELILGKQETRDFRQSTDLTKWGHFRHLLWHKSVQSMHLGSSYLPRNTAFHYCVRLFLCLLGLQVGHSIFMMVTNSDWV